MSLFDYHGRFSRSQDDSDSSKEDSLSTRASSSKSIPKHKKVDTPEETKEPLVEEDAEHASNAKEAPAVDESSQDESHASEEVTDEGSSDALEEASETEGPEDADEGADSEVTSEDEDLDSDEEDESGSDEETESQESDASGESDDAEALTEEEPSDGSSSEQTSKKKKTPASKGKHAASTYALPVEEDPEDLQLSPKRSRGVLKGFGIAACVIVVLAALVYGAGVLVFMNRILPNTVISSHDISLYTNEEAINLLESIEKNYTIDVKMGTFGYQVTKADINLDLDAPAIIEAIHEQYDALKWPLYIFALSHDTSDALNVTFDPAGYESGFLEAIAEYNKTATPPTDASIYYDEGAKRYLIKNEVMGTQIDPALALVALSGAIHDLQPILRLTEAELVQPGVRANDEFIIESAKLANSLASSKISLVVNDAVVRDISNPELSKCIRINEKSEVTFDEKALEELCTSVAKEFNTIGTERVYTRADGKAVTVKDGSYGWAVDEKALKDLLQEAIMTGDSATVVVPFETTADVYLGPGQRDWGNRYIDVDLSEQYVRFYGEDGTIIWETPCITGSPDGYHNTPQGVWSVTDHMESPSKLVGYENGRKIYESYVTYWMPFIKNSIGLHDATWQPSFGGSMYANGYGSHGCVNISYNAARELWNLVHVGDVVVTHF